MDAKAYLRNHGWRGDGHSLDHTNRGIKKPLLVSKKVDVLGVGLNKHSTVSDQWWLRAFDQGLKSLGTGEVTALEQVQKHGVKRGELYGRFVKGEKIPGSIGQSLVPTPEDSDGTTTHTPAEPQSRPSAKMKVDVPPRDKLERVVGIHDDQNAHNAMMYVLQNPDDAPAGMKKMLDRKRKRAERPVEKRARRKIEMKEKSKAHREENRRQAMEEGTWDAEKEEERQRDREINRRAKEFVLEAQRQGLIPAGPNEIRKGLVPTGANATAMQGQQDAALQQVFHLAGLDTGEKSKGSGKKSIKGDKYAREKAKRELKRAAKAYLMGEKPAHEETKEERRARRDKEKQEKALKRAEAEKREADRLAMQEERQAMRQAKKAAKRAEKEEIGRIIAEREAAKKEGITLNGYHAKRAAAATNGETSASNGFDAGANEIKFGMNSRGGKKKIPGVGTVDRYPTKAEKKAKKLQAMAIQQGISDAELKARIEAENAAKVEQERLKVDRYRAIKHGLTLDEYYGAVTAGQVHHPWVERKNIPSEKLAEYQERADQKGISLQEYIRRREEKKAQKQSEKLGNPFQQDILANTEFDDSYGAVFMTARPELHQQNSIQKPRVSAPHSDGAASDNLGFVVDLTGDENLGTKSSKMISVPASTENPLAIVDADGDETLAWEPNMPVPLDPRLWQGKDVKSLPRPIRKARKEWMRLRREAKKAQQSEGAKKPQQKKAKGQRKIEAREAFVKQVLNESRKALRTGNSNVMVTIEGIENVPLVKVKTSEGAFKKDEVALARTVARRVLRNVRRQQKAEKGKGKGWKKRERSAKEAARNAGISGFTDRARLDGRGTTNADLLL